MRSYLNPWSIAVVKRHPEISICDQWQFVKDRETDLYVGWWSQQNVHFRGRLADALGEFLGEHVAKVVGVSLDGKPASAAAGTKESRR